jgi:hypothetical protein
MTRNEQVTALRAKVGEERTALKNLEQKFREPSMKEEARGALMRLDDTEYEITRLDIRPMTDSEFAGAIQNAKLPYKLAVATRIKLHNRMVTIGPGAMAI